MEKTTQRFQRIATTFADLNAEGLNVQTVNDLLTMYVGAASQHVLRMSFVPEQEAHNFDREVMTFWSHLHASQRHLSIILFTPQTWRTAVGFAVERHAAAPWRAWQHVILLGWQQPSHRTQTPFSMRHHDAEPNAHNSTPHIHSK